MNVIDFTIMCFFYLSSTFNYKNATILDIRIFSDKKVNLVDISKR